jgi:O-antigen/teichoic acid export membrane protein
MDWRDWLVYGYGYGLLGFFVLFGAVGIGAFLFRVAKRLPDLIRKKELGMILFLAFFIGIVPLSLCVTFDFYPEIFGTAGIVLYVSMLIYAFVCVHKPPAVGATKGQPIDPPGGWTAEDFDGDGGGD